MGTCNPHPTRMRGHAETLIGFAGIFFLNKPARESKRSLLKQYSFDCLFFFKGRRLVPMCPCLQTFSRPPPTLFFSAGPGWLGESRYGFNCSRLVFPNSKSYGVSLGRGGSRKGLVMGAFRGNGWCCWDHLRGWLIPST